MAAIIYLDIAKMPGEDGNVCVHSFTVNPLATDNKWKDNYEVAGPTDTAQLKVAELCRVAEEIELPNGSQIIVFTTNESVTEDGNRFISRQGQEPAQNTDLWQKLNENGRYHSARKASCLSMYMRILVHTFRT